MKVDVEKAGMTRQAEDLHSHLRIDWRKDNTGG